MRPKVERRHDAVALIVAMAAAWIVTPLARAGWAMSAVPTSFSTSFLWLDYAYLSLWAFELLWGALFGFFLTRALRSPFTLLWSLACGAVLGLLHLKSSTNWFAPDAPLSRYVWAYGGYLVPLAGALVGHWLALRFAHSRKTLSGVHLR